MVSLSLLIALLSLPFSLSLCPSPKACRRNAIPILGGNPVRRRLEPGSNDVVGICDGLKEEGGLALAVNRALTTWCSNGRNWVGLSAVTRPPQTITTTRSQEMRSSFGLASSWGVLTTIAILFNSIWRLARVAFHPFNGYPPLTSLHWGLYLLSCIALAYAEGYKGFHKQFSPLVVKRALSLDEGRSGPIQLLLAGPFSMGYFHATKGRRIRSWSVTLVVTGMTQIIKRLPYPWRSIIDAGAVVGLSIGCISILWYWVRSWSGTPPPRAVDPGLPPKTTTNSSGPYE